MAAKKPPHFQTQKNHVRLQSDGTSVFTISGSNFTGIDVLATQIGASSPQHRYFDVYALPFYDPSGNVDDSQLHIVLVYRKTVKGKKAKKGFYGTDDVTYTVSAGGVAADNQSDVIIDS